MPTSYTNSTIIYRTGLDGTDGLTLLAAVHSALTAAGWPSVAIANGFRYTITSPQGLVAKVNVTGFAGFNLFVQFQSASGAQLGNNYQIFCGAGQTFQLWANVCQLFLSQPGSVANMVCGGVPYVPVQSVDCAGVPALPSQCWWASGTGGGIDFRKSYYCSSSPYDACYGSVLIQNNGNTPYALHIVPIAGSGDQESNIAVPAQIETPAGSAFWFDPFLMWGSDFSTPSLSFLRAQIWDVLWYSMPQALEAALTINSLGWLAFNSCVFGSLMLLTTSPSSTVSNVAY